MLDTRLSGSLHPLESIWHAGLASSATIGIKKEG